MPAFFTQCGAGGQFLEFGQLVKGVKDAYWAEFTQLNASYGLMPVVKGVFANGLREGTWYIYANNVNLGVLTNIVTFKDDVPDGWFLSSYFVYQGSGPNYVTFSATGTLQGPIPSESLTIPTSVEGVHFSGDWEFRLNGAYTGGAHIMNGTGHMHYVDARGNAIDGDISGGMLNGVWTFDNVAQSEHILQYKMQDGKVVSSEAIVSPPSVTTSFGPAPPVVPAPPTPTHPSPTPPAPHSTTCSIPAHLAACASALVAPFQDPGCSVICQYPNHPAYCVPDSCSGDSYTRELCVCRQ